MQTARAVRKSAESAVMAMNARGWTLATIDSLPPATALPLQAALLKCRQAPPPGMQGRFSCRLLRHCLLESACQSLEIGKSWRPARKVMPMLSRLAGRGVHPDRARGYCDHGRRAAVSGAAEGLGRGPAGRHSHRGLCRGRRHARRRRQPASGWPEAAGAQIRKVHAARRPGHRGRGLGRPDTGGLGTATIPAAPD